MGREKDLKVIKRVCKQLITESDSGQGHHEEQFWATGENFKEKTEWKSSPRIKGCWEN